MKKFQDHPNDDRLSQLLKALPREKASQDFLTRTVRASARFEKKRGFYFGAFVAIATFLLALMLHNLLQEPAPSASEIAKKSESANIEANLNELKRINNELKQIQRMSQNTKKALRISSDPKNQYILDLHSFATITGETTYAHFRPTRTF